MKKFLLSLGIILFSLNSYAFDSVIGLGGGYNKNKSNTTHAIIFDYANPDFDSTKPVDSSNQERLKNLISNQSSDQNNLYNINFEYQARFDAFLIGIGFDNSKASVNPNYKNLSKFNYTENTPYFIAMLDLFKNKYIAFRLGADVGLSFIKTDYESKTNSTASFLIDGEVNLSKNIMVFSRFSYEVTPKYDLVYNTNLSIPIPSQYTDPNVLANWISTEPKSNLFQLNFGIRYKI